MVNCLVGACIQVHYDECVPRSAIASNLIGAAEITQILGLSRQRVSQLMGVEGFPEPFRELVMGKIYLRDEVEAWAKRHGYPIHPLTKTSKATPDRSRVSDGLPRPRARRRPTTE
jgi:predicted DNA-binding transcriptional regulator AlpA